MTPFGQYHSRYLGFRTALDVNQLLKHVEEDAAGLNNLFMAGLGMGTLFLRMGAVIQISEKLHDGDTGNDALFMKQVMDNLRETLPSDTNWKNLWYASMTPESKWDNAIPRDSNKVSMLDRFVAFRNKYVHQSIRLIPEHLKDIEKGIQVLDDMASLFVLFEAGEIELKDERHFWRQGESALDLSPFVQKGAQEGLPYLFQGFYENKSKAKFINTVYGDETLPEANLQLDEKFEPIQQALSGGAGQVFDHSERLKYYLDCFVGREREVRSVLEWVNGDSMNNVLPIYSEAGMGKGALTAGVIDGLMHDGIPVMYHYCGSGMANSLHAVLYHFILQGKKLPGMNGAGIWKVKDESVQRRMDRLPSRYLDAIHLFQQLLDDCYNPPKKYEDKPLVIVIDGLDEAAVANSQLNVSDWFYRYNDKDEPEADWKSPGFVKWIFTYRSLPGNRKEGYRLDGRFSLEQNELIQPIRGLTEGAVRAAVKSYNLSEDFITTLIERGREDGNNIDPAYFKLIFNAIRNSGTADYEQVTLPLGLSGIYEDRFQLQPISIRNLINNTFVTIAHLLEPFSLDLLAQINPKIHKEFFEFILNNFSDLFSFVNSNRFEVNHDRLRNFLLQYNSSNTQYLNIEILILNALNQIAQNQKSDLSIYSLKHLSKHLLFVGIRDFEDNRLYKISTDLSFFKKQYEELNTRFYSHAFINDALKLMYYRSSEINSTLKLLPSVITLFELKGELEFNDINSLSSIANLMIAKNIELGLSNFSSWHTYVVKHVKSNGSNSPGEFIFLGYIYLIIRISRSEELTYESKADLIIQFNQYFLNSTPNSSDFYTVNGDDLLEFFFFENESMILIEYFNVLRSFNLDYCVIVEKISKKENISRYNEEIEKPITDSNISRRFKQKVTRTWDVWEFNNVFYKARAKQLGGDPEGGEVFGNDDLVEIYWDLIEDGVRENEQYLEKIVSEFKVIKHRKALCERNLIINSCSLQFGIESLNSYLTWPRFVSPDGDDYNLFLVDLIDYNLPLGNIKIVEVLFRKIARFPEFSLLAGNFENICKGFNSEEVWNYGFYLLNLYEEYADLNKNHISYYLVYECLVLRLVELKDFANVSGFCKREILIRKKHYLKRFTEDLVIKLLKTKIKNGYLWKVIDCAFNQEYDSTENFLFIKFRLYTLIQIKDWKSEWVDEEDLSIENIATSFSALCDFCEHHLDTAIDYCHDDDILEMVFELLRRCIFVSKDFSTIKAISVFYKLGYKSDSALSQDSDFGWDTDGVKRFLDYLALFCCECNIDFEIYKSIIISEVRLVYIESKVNELSLRKKPSEKFVLKGIDYNKYFNHGGGRNREMRYHQLLADDVINYIQNSNTLEIKSRALQDVSKFICISQITEEFLVKVLPLYSKFDVSADLLLRKYHAKLIIDGKGKFERVKSEYYDLSFLVDSFMIQEISEKEDFDVFIDILNWSVLDKIPDVNFIIDYISDDFFKTVILLVCYKLGKVDGAQVKSFVENLEVARDDEQFVVDGFLFCVNHFNKKDIVIGEIDRILNLADEVLIGFFVDEDTGEVYERTEHRVFVYFYLSFCFFTLDHVQKTKETFYSCLEFSLDIDSDSGKEWMDIVISIWKNLFGIDDLKKFALVANDSLKSGRLLSKISDTDFDQ